MLKNIFYATRMIFIVSGIFYQHLERKWCMHTRTNTCESDPIANWIILPLNCSKIFSRLQEIFFLHLDYISIVIREINAYTHLHTPLKVPWSWILSLPKCSKIFFRSLEIFSLCWQFFYQQLVSSGQIIIIVHPGRK